jgi:hypothetical protein
MTALVDSSGVRDGLAKNHVKCMNERAIMEKSRSQVNEFTFVGAVHCSVYNRFPVISLELPKNPVVYPVFS